MVRSSRLFGPLLFLLAVSTPAFGAAEVNDYELRVLDAVGSSVDDCIYTDVSLEVQSFSGLQGQEQLFIFITRYDDCAKQNYLIDFSEVLPEGAATLDQWTGAVSENLNLIPQFPSGAEPVNVTIDLQWKADGPASAFSLPACTGLPDETHIQAESVLTRSAVVSGGITVGNGRVSDFYWTQVENLRLSDVIISGNGGNRCVD